MRRKEREITDRSRMLDVLAACPCFRLGITDGDDAYIVPLSFGLYSDGSRISIYFHSATEGRKIELLKKTPRVTFEADIQKSVTGGDVPCSWTSFYECVMGHGIVTFIEDPEEKARAFNLIMEHYSGKGDWTFPESALARTALLRLDVTDWTCKIH